MTEHAGNHKFGPLTHLVGKGEEEEAPSTCGETKLVKCPRETLPERVSRELLACQHRALVMLTSTAL